MKETDTSTLQTSPSAGAATNAPNPSANSLKRLFSDTMIYGLSSIVGRFLNYLLVPLYTYKIAATSGGYGVVTEIYAYTALLLVILTFGMETTFFFFANQYKDRADKVFSTAALAVGGVSALFVLLVVLFEGPVTSLMGYSAHPEFVVMMAVVVAVDAFQAIFFALLRFQGRAWKFAIMKLLFIVLSMGMNLFIFLLAPGLYESHPSLMGWYNPDYQVGYIFVVNLISLHLAVVVAGHCGHVEPGGRQNMLQPPCARRGRTCAIGHIWGLFQDCHDYGHDYPGIPLCLRAVCVWWGARVEQPRKPGAGDEIFHHFRPAGILGGDGLS